MRDNTETARRAPKRNGWTKATRARFLTVLAATCNVTAAARAVDKTAAMARTLRKRDGDFARAWQEALEGGYDRLKDELLSRALGGETDQPPLDPVLAIKLLQMYGEQRGGKAGDARTMTQDEVDTMLLERLDALAARRGAVGGAAGNAEGA